MHKKGKCDEDDEYQIDQANLIRNLNDGLMKVIVNPINDNIREFTSDLIWESSDEPNKIKKKIEGIIIKSLNHSLDIG